VLLICRIKYREWDRRKRERERVDAGMVEYRLTIFLSFLPIPVRTR